MHVTQQTHLADDFITWEQEASKEMFFLSKGKVALMSGDGRRIYSILSEGSLFGDFEVLKGIPRTASAQVIATPEPRWSVVNIYPAYAVMHGHVHCHKPLPLLCRS